MINTLFLLMLLSVLLIILVFNRCSVVQVRPIKSENGFGMIDALIGIALLGLIVIIVGHFAALGASSRTAVETTKAVYLAQAALEDLKRNDGQTLKNWNFIKPVGYPQYNVTVTQLPPTNGLFPCQVRVTWGTHRVQLIGYYY